MQSAREACAARPVVHSGPTWFTAFRVRVDFWALSVHLSLMQQGSTYRSRDRVLSVGSMLLAVLALILHGAVPVMAYPAAQGGIHFDCPGHTQVMQHVGTGGHHDHQASPTSSGSEKIPMPDRQMHCCTSVAAVVLPTFDATGFLDVPASRWTPDRSTPVLEGHIPEGPSKPPRTSYQS